MWREESAGVWWKDEKKRGQIEEQKKIVGIYDNIIFKNNTLIRILAV